MARNIDGYFYGTAVVMGDLLLEGPLEQLHLDLTVATKDGTNFKIPLDNPTAVEMPSYIRVYGCESAEIGYDCCSRTRILYHGHSHTSNA